MNDVSNNNEYSELLVSDNNGNVDKIYYLSLDQNEKVDIEISTQNYLNLTADENKVCECGTLGFRLKNNEGNADFELRLIDDKIFNDLGTNKFTINFGGKYFGNNQEYLNKNYSLEFELDEQTKNIEDKKHFQFKSVREKIPLNQINIFTIIIPKQNNLYRLTAAMLNNSSTNNLNVLVCEKFYIKEIGS